MSTTHGRSDSVLAAGQSAVGAVREHPAGFTRCSRPTLKALQALVHLTMAVGVERLKGASDGC